MQYLCCLCKELVVLVLVGCFLCFCWVFFGCLFVCVLVFFLLVGFFLPDFHNKSTLNSLGFLRSKMKDNMLWNAVITGHYMDFWKVPDKWENNSNYPDIGLSVTCRLLGTVVCVAHTGLREVSYLL